MAVIIAYIVSAIQEYGFGYTIQLPEFPLGLLLLAGPVEETLFFGILFYLSNNHYVVLAVGVLWAEMHAFNADVSTFTLEYLSYPNLAVAAISLFYSLRTWASGKGWFSIFFHSLYNGFAFVLMGISGENPWIVSADGGITEITMLIFSVPLLGITYGLYRWRKRREKKKEELAVRISDCLSYIVYKGLREVGVLLAGGCLVRRCGRRRSDVGDWTIFKKWSNLAGMYLR